MARLVIETEGRRRLYEILEDQITVGSDQDSQVRLPTAHANRQHLRLTRQGDAYRVVVLEPGQAVRINGCHSGLRTRPGERDIRYRLSVLIDRSGGELHRLVHGLECDSGRSDRHVHDTRSWWWRCGRLE